MSMKAKLVLDFGNSGTRGIVKFPVESDGVVKTKEVRFDLSNQFARVEKENYVVPEDYSEATSTMFRLTNAKVADESVSGVFVNGDVCENEFKKASTRPTALFKKYRNLTTALTFAQAILVATKKIQEGVKASTLNELDIVWDIVALLPPADLDKGIEKMEAIFRSISSVDYLFPEVRLNITIDKVKIFPEGFCAYIATMFMKGSKIRPSMADWLNATVLILDIGAGTSDRLIASKMSVIDNSRDTVDIGGNQVTQAVKSTLRKEYDLPLPDEAIAEGVKTGYVMDGLKKRDIIREVQDAKNTVASAEVNSLVDYFEEIQFPVRTLQGLLVCGGGSLEGDIPALFPLSQAILKFLKELAPNSELVPLPKDENGNEISPRELNIVGAGILADTI